MHRKHILMKTDIMTLEVCTDFLMKQKSTTHENHKNGK